jgi:hypothetical protein
LLGGVKVPLLQREAGQRTEVIHGDEMLAESQTPRLGLGGVGSIGETARLQPCQRPEYQWSSSDDALPGYGDAR